MKIKKHLRLLKDDPKSEIAFLSRKSRIIFNTHIWTLINRNICHFKGVELKQNVRFLGKSYFVRTQNSKIEIDTGCIFNSAPFYNLIGINRACMVSTLSNNANIFIGKNCSFSGTVIGAYKHIKLGNNIKCGANTLITDFDWHLDDKRSGVPADVIIEDNVWLGEGVKVLKGVKIGTNSLIGAGSIVAKDIPANVIAAGNPCIVIKSI